MSIAKVKQGLNKGWNWMRGKGTKPLNAVKSAGSAVQKSAMDGYGAHGASGVLGLGPLKAGADGFIGAVKKGRDVQNARRTDIQALTSTGKAREDAIKGINEKHGSSAAPMKDLLWNAPEGAMNWITAADLGKDATTGQRWMAGGIRTIGGAAAADFLNPFSLGWND